METENKLPTAEGSPERLVGRRPQIGDKWLRGLTGAVEIVDISATRVWLLHHEPGREPKYSSRKLEEWDEAFAKTLAVKGTTFHPANGAAPSADPRQGVTSDAVAGSALAEAGRARQIP